MIVINTKVSTLIMIVLIVIPLQVSIYCKVMNNDAYILAYVTTLFSHKPKISCKFRISHAISFNEQVSPNCININNINRNLN